MSVRKDRNKKGRRRIVCDQTWPDGKRFRRQMPNRKTAEELDARITVAKANATWKDLRYELEYGKRPNPTIDEYSKHYLAVYCRVHNKASSCQRKRFTFKMINKHIGQVRLDEMDQRILNVLKLARIEDGIKPATVNRDVGTLRHLFEFAIEEGVLKDTPIGRTRKLKEARPERPKVTEKQFELIAQHLPFPVLQIVTLIFETGCRPSEALRLESDQVDFERKVAIFNLRKGGDNALVALTTRAVEAIRQVPPLPGCPYVFWNPKTQTRYERVNETFARAREKAGLDGVQLKDFRRAAAITIAESGQPLHVAQTQLGHSSIRTTEKYYAHFSPEFAVGRARDALEKRWRQTGGNDPEPENSRKSVSHAKSKVVDFQTVRNRRFGGGERIRTAE